MKEIILIVTMWIVTICTYISYVPQIVKLTKTKKSEDLSITSWVLWVLSALANSLYSCILGRPELIIASASELALTLAVLLLTIYYSKRERHYGQPADYSNCGMIGEGRGSKVHIQNGRKGSSTNM